MDESLTETARSCLASAYEGTLDFPAIVGTLKQAGFEGYTIDYRRGTAVYFLPSGESVALDLPKEEEHVAAEFSADVVGEAVREAQTGAPGYTYRGFCSKVKAAGCAGYMVSFLGRRVVYFGRTAETHVEHFPS